MHLKKLFQKNEFQNYLGPLVYIRNSFFLNNFFLGAFGRKDKFIFLKSTLNSVSFDTHKPILWKKIWTHI
jgi:hypothetical protein